MKLVSRIRSVFRLGAAQVVVLVLLGALPVILALTAITASMSPPKASAVGTPPSLVGESFSASTVTGSFTCSAGPSGSATFTASGVATGPYPGTFLETGSATVTPAFPLPTVTFSATFSITSPAGSVTGTKSFSGHFGVFDAANCLSVVEFAFVIGTSPPPVSYHATINSSLGTATDSGDADAHLCLCVPTNVFSEDFTRSNGVVAVCNEDSQGQNQNEQNDQIEDTNDQCGEGD